jgi:hypothetical protein
MEKVAEYYPRTVKIINSIDRAYHKAKREGRTERVRTLRDRFYRIAFLVYRSASDQAKVFDDASHDEDALNDPASRNSFFIARDYFKGIAECMQEGLNETLEEIVNEKRV